MTCSIVDLNTQLKRAEAVLVDAVLAHNKAYLRCENFAGTIIPRALVDDLRTKEKAVQIAVELATSLRLAAIQRPSTVLTEKPAKVSRQHTLRAWRKREALCQ
jgi:hypothetical protein